MDTIDIFVAIVFDLQILNRRATIACTMVKLLMTIKSFESQIWQVKISIPGVVAVKFAALGFVRVTVIVLIRGQCIIAWVVHLEQEYRVVIITGLRQG